MDAVYNLVESVHVFIPLVALLVFLTVVYINSKTPDEPDTALKKATQKTHGKEPDTKKSD
ncbi:Protein CBG04189 [Caenorhabditis briggsae]|uniref:Protein CBG04189 n=1 Tax=Caenorhabditis briggsae TaxID=6238 RepID=A8WWD6_CAEBR|nr:Protein CBG04189 [Caenorhabditis briggsae]CAP24945.1 Protein CBG04189 [Caenorhabditis briggsae]